MNKTVCKLLCIILTVTFILFLYLYIINFRYIKSKAELQKQISLYNSRKKYEAQKTAEENKLNDNVPKKELRFILADFNYKPVNNEYYKWIFPCSRNFTVMLENNRMGVINKQGIYIIKPEFSKISCEIIDKKRYYKAMRIVISEKNGNYVFEEEKIIFDENGIEIKNKD